VTGKAVVTGGTGFLGSRVVEILAERGHDVVSVSRSGRPRWEPPAGVQYVALDLASADAERTLPQIVAGARTVVHAAGALYRPSTPHGAFRLAHVDGTRRVIEALARMADPRAPVRLVHVSTTGVLGPTADEPVDEMAVLSPTNEYERTKLEGESLALVSRLPGLEVVVARPGLVYGPRNLHLLPLFRSIASGTFRTIAGGRAVWQPIHVDDVVRGIGFMTAGGGLDGETFHLAGGERLTVTALAARIADALGVAPRRGSLPYALAFAAGAVLEAAYAPLGADPPLSRSRVRTMTQSRVYAIDKARERLSFRPEIDLTRGLAGTVAWYRSSGLLA
jgi:nucleoside-diphosphate-sugar epimerase